MMFLQITQPMQMYALTSGPSQPEFNSFTPIGTSDMVDLASGDFSYNIPIMDVGGYPINLAYNSGVTMDQEASWVGLGWNLNIGQINRNVRGLPDDFNGDEIETSNNLRDNITVGVTGYVNPQLIGALDKVPVKLGGGLSVQYNNYHGISATPSFGISFELSKYVSVGAQLSSSNENGASITPNISLSAKSKNTDMISQLLSGSLSPSLAYNSRQGLTSFNLSYSNSYLNNISFSRLGSGSGSISFLNNTFTPSKRLGFVNNNATFSFSVGPDMWGLHVEGSITASASSQRLIQKNRTTKAYGYEFTENASGNDLLDFNREKEQSVVSVNTLILPVTNYTYDLLSIQGQGIGGQVRPFRGQVGYVYDPYVNDVSSSNSFGGEVEGGAGGHIGANFKHSYSNSFTANWNTKITQFLQEKKSGNAFNYENVYYKNVGERRIDQEYNTMFENKLGEYSPITLKLVDEEASNQYLKKLQVDTQNGLSELGTANNIINTAIKRNERENRNQVTQKITKAEVNKFGLQNIIETYSNAKPHHTAGYIITDENGSRHIFGKTAYNKVKEEVTFAVGGIGDARNGLVQYAPNVDNTNNNRSGIDHYFSSTKTPDYAHTYLLSSILSSDYEDLTSNGPTDDDLGTYTKFEYTTPTNYNWRVPIEANKASYNEGLKTNTQDQKASYIYGEKEIKYVKKIVTKTHVAFIDLEDRKDGFGTYGKNGGVNTAMKMKRIKSIRLYSKHELTINNGIIVDPDEIIGNTIKPIKKAHFEYDYSLCGNTTNNSGASETVNNVNLNANKGKLTLKKVYFTYRGSYMGKYTPYKFHYESNNPEYNPKNYDVWGNYKNNLITSANDWNNVAYTTPQEFPYVEQNKDQQDDWSSSWSLTSIDLPSGGKIEVAFESDDYQYVQNKKAMQMFKVAGVTSAVGEAISQNLYGGTTGQAKYVVVNVNQEDQSLPNETIVDKYAGAIPEVINSGGNKVRPIYFNFFLNMANGKSDYVSGYFEMNNDALVQGSVGSKKLYIPMKQIHEEGKFIDNQQLTNPISVAGWFFARQNLHHQLYNDNFDPSLTNVVDIGRSLMSNLGAMVEIFIGPNGRLKAKGCAKTFVANKSWIRLNEPSGSKLGGGTRFKKIEMYDAWDEMLNVQSSSTDIQRYKKKYGQEYNYALEDGTSSGVATYEPNVCKENPLIVPFYHKAEKMAAQAYEEKPFGESFYPGATVTYRKVTVKNITAADDDQTGDEVRNTKSGKVVTQHYTSYDFPTKSDFTTLDNPLTKDFKTNENQAIGNVLKGMLGLKIDVTSKLSMTQGFVIETNDMNGKMKKQEVFNHGNDLISSVEYKYNTDEDDASSLNSELTVINKDGSISNSQALGMHYDVINDFKLSYSEMNMYGAAVNVDVIPIFIPIVVGFGVPERAVHRQILKTAVTTKVIHKTGIIKETIAFDLGSKVSTKNLAWDAITGQVLLTETINEFDDKYFSFNYPAYWHYDRMGLASENIDLKGELRSISINNSGSEPFSYFDIQGSATNDDISKFLKLGDEIVYETGNSIKKLWVSGYNSNMTNIQLIDHLGLPIELDVNDKINFRIIRSGNRNQQMASMASITLKTNPLDIVNGRINDELLLFNTGESNDPKIINSSAVEYSEVWLSQCENRLPDNNGLINGTGTKVNEYLYNILGDWRAVKSYAYLTGRNTEINAQTRNSGYYKSFNPFYTWNGVDNWIITPDKWTAASEVTQYSPYGMELENKDALDRYSSAQYGYNYTLPNAVVSNSKYMEMGFDGFEDYNPFNYAIPNLLRPHFGFSQNVNPNAQVTDKKSHTGRNSIVLKANTSIELTRKINGCKEPNNNN